MSTPFYKKATVQAAIIGGLLGFLAAVCSAYVIGWWGFRSGHLDFPKRAIQLKVFDFRNVGDLAVKEQAGERYSGYLLDQLFRIRVKAGPGSLDSNEVANQVRYHISPVRGAPPPSDEFDALRSLAPVLLVYGWVEDGEAKGTFLVHSRVTLLGSNYQAFEALAIDERVVGAQDIKSDARGYASYIAQGLIPTAQGLESGEGQ